MIFYKRLLTFIFSFIITFAVGFLIWDFSINSGFVTQIFTASISSAPKSSILKSEEAVERPEEKIIEPVEVLVEPEPKISKQDLLDSIAEKLDVIQSEVDNLIAEKNPEKSDKIEEEDKDKEVKEDEKNKNDESEKTNYPKILIFETKISPIEQRFIKFYNPNSESVDLTGWYLQRKTATGADYTSCITKDDFAGKIILPNNYLVITKDGLILTENNSLVLKNPNGEIVDIVQTVAETIVTTVTTGGGGGTIDSCSSFDNILISEIQIEGETSDDDWVELYNPNDTPACLNNWSIQKASKTGNISGVKQFGNSDLIPQKGYFLVVNSHGSQIGDIAWAGLELSSSLAQGNTVYLVKSKGEIIDGNDSNIVDKVGYGLAADYKEAPALKTEQSKTISRIWDDETQNYKNIGNNSADFEVGKPTPKAQNAAYSEPITFVKTLKFIDITNPANKLSYYIREPLDIAGLIVSGVYVYQTEDGEIPAGKEPITITTNNITGFDSSISASEQILTINFEGLTATYAIEITEALPATQLKIISSPQTIIAGEPSGVFTVESQDEAGILSKVLETTYINLSSDSFTGLFSSSSASGPCGDNWTKTSITMSKNTAHKSFCYKDDTPGIFKITVSDSAAVLLSDFQDIKITTSPSNL